MAQDVQDVVAVPDAVHICGMSRVAHRAAPGRTSPTDPGEARWVGGNGHVGIPASVDVVVLVAVTRPVGQCSISASNGGRSGYRHASNITSFGPHAAGTEVPAACVGA
jgi:hypothetical protein